MIGTETLGTYTDKQQETVVYWVALRPIIDICNRETGYQGGGRRRELWWRQTAAQNQLIATLEDILAAAKARNWESGRCGKGGGGGR